MFTLVFVFSPPLPRATTAQGLLADPSIEMRMSVYLNNAYRNKELVVRYDSDIASGPLVSEILRGGGGVAGREVLTHMPCCDIQKKTKKQARWD